MKSDPKYHFLKLADKNIQETFFYLYIDKFHFFLKKLNPTYFCLLMVLLSYISGMICITIGLLFNLEIPEQAIKTTIQDGNPVFNLLFAGIITPLFETLIFQTGPIEFLHQKTNCKNKYIILISALIFALAHYPYSSLIIQLWLFSFAIILAYSYVLYKKKMMRPTIMTWSIHAIRNSISIFIIWIG